MHKDPCFVHTAVAFTKTPDLFLDGSRKEVIGLFDVLGSDGKTSMFRTNKTPAL